MKKNKPTNFPPLFMMAQIPFNREDAVKLNTPMTEIMDDKGNLHVTLSNLKELGIWNTLIQSGTRFLEIGCGRGYLLSHLYQRGKGKYYGLEPISSQYQIALKNLLQLNIKDFNRSSTKNLLKSTVLEKTQFPKSYFDIIYSYHVFEHLENPLLMLEHGKKWLKPGGRMIITCPNVEGYFPSRNLPSWRCSINSHRWLPGLSTIRRAIEQSGYTVEKYFTYGGYPASRSWKKNLFNRWLKSIHQGDVMCLMAKRL